MNKVPTVVETNTFDLLKWLWALKEETDRVVVTLNYWEKDSNVYIDVNCYAELEFYEFGRYTRIPIKICPEGYRIDNGNGSSDKCYDLHHVRTLIVKAISDDDEDYEYMIDIWKEDTK